MVQQPVSYRYDAQWPDDSRDTAQTSWAVCAHRPSIDRREYESPQSRADLFRRTPPEHPTREGCLGASRLTLQGFTPLHRRDDFSSDHLGSLHAIGPLWVNLTPRRRHLVNGEPLA
jgi:hypothetical protein